jgi:hypothetical protein
MRDVLRRNPVLAVLGLLAVALAAVLAVELTTGGPTVPAGASRKAVPAEVKLLPPMAATVPEQAYPETAARPLFSPTRRPAPPVVAAAQPTMQRGQFVLLGVTMAGETRIAMLRERSSGRIVRVEKGRDVNGLRVAEIERESVTLAAGAENETVSLTVQKPGAPAPGQPAPAGAPPTAAAAPQGPFGQSAFGNAPTTPAANVNVPHRAAPPPAAPGGAPAPAAAPTGGPMGAAPVNPNNAPPPQAAPMTPEELLERRRARRAQQTQ